MVSPKSLAQAEYKYGFVTDIEEETAPRGLTEDTIRWISAKKQEPEFMLEWRLRAFRHFLKLVEEQQSPKWANVHYPPINFQGRRVLRRAEEGPPREPRGRGQGAARHVREAGHPAGGAEAAGGRRRGRGVRQRVGRDDVQGDAEQAGDHLRLVQRGGAGAPGAGAEVPRLGGAVHGQLLRRAEFGRLLRRLVLLHPEGRAVSAGALHLLPHQRRRGGAVRADADHRGGGLVRELPRGVQRADAGHQPAPRRRGGARRDGERGDQVLDHPELVPGRRERRRRHLQLRDQAGQVRWAPTRKSRGRRSRRARRSRGSTRACCCRATTPSASSTRSR